MLGLLRRLFGGVDTDKKEDVSATVAVRASADKAAETRSENESGNIDAASDDKDTRDSAFFCREVLVGRDQKIVGYEFGFPQHLQSSIMEKRVRVRQYYDDLLLRHLAGLELDSFLGDRLALVEISHASLKHPSLAVLLYRKVSLLLSFPETGVLDARTLAEITAIAKQLRDSGARIGLKWQSHWPRKAADFPVLPQADFIQVAWPDCADPDCAAFFSDLRRIGVPSAPMKLIVGGLQTPDDFWQCYRLGADYFRGVFINNRGKNRGTKSTINRLRVLQLLNGLRRDPDASHLEEEMKQDPVLSYRLLAYANSPLLGMTDKVTHLGRAVTVIGRDNLYRWLASLLFNVNDPNYYEYALTEQALARAALMERLGKNASGVKPDALFLTGLFSLLDQLMNNPLEELVTQVQLAADIQLALIRREGVLARFLALAEACERMDPETIEQHAEALGLSSRTISLAVFDALSWAHAMTQLNEA
ncbi:MAG: HDOD domain-containing protein [Candidatus Accumulibacter sp.]|nr:HDOD domain-containing protein [Accumulibacter sp.]